MTKLLLGLVCAVAMAQSPAPLNVPPFGALACAAIRRPPDRVQTYCYIYPPAPNWVLVHNQLSTVPAIGGVIVAFAESHQDEQSESSGGITWKFARMEDGTVLYEYAVGHEGGVDPMVTGELP